MTPEPLFPLGKVYATPGALQALQAASTSPLPYLLRHVTGDWGELDQEDIEANNDALVRGERLLSAYTLPTGVKVWLITESDRSSTACLLPEEY